MVVSDRPGRCLRGARVTLVMSAALVVLGACSVSVSTGKSLNVEKGEKAFERVIESQTGASVDRVDCPERKIKKGDVFECTASLDGQSLRLKVTQTDDKGNVDFRADQAIIVVEKAQSQIGSEIQRQTGVSVRVTCSDHKFLFEDVGATFECPLQAASSSATSGVVTVVVKDLDGNVSFRVN